MKKPYLLIITAILYLVLTGGMSLAKDSGLEARKQAVKMNPDNANAHANLGLAYIKSGMHKEAIEAYRQAIRINPDDTDAYHNLGLSYGKSGKYKEAIEPLRRR